MPTKNGKMLQERFDERTEIEKEKISLKEEERKLVDKYDNLNNELRKVMEKPSDSPEEQMAKEAEITSIQEEINKIADELLKVREKIKEKEKELDKANEKINEMIEIVIEDEHKLNQQQQQLEKERNGEKVELLMAKLAA